MNPEHDPELVRRVELAVIDSPLPGQDEPVTHAIAYSVLDALAPEFRAAFVAGAKWWDIGDSTNEVDRWRGQDEALAEAQERYPS